MELQHHIHIQSYSTIVVVERSRFEITAVTQNIEALVDRPAEQWIGQALHTLLPDKFVAQVRELSQGGEHSIIGLGIIEGWPEERYQVIPRLIGNEIMLEIEVRQPISSRDLYSIGLRDVAQSVPAFEETPKLLSYICRTAKKYLDYDRVLIYQFDSDGNGMVVAEEIDPGIEPLLGTYYWADDVPDYVRDKHFSSVVQHLADADEPLSPLVGTVNDEVAYVLEGVIASQEPYDIAVQFCQQVGLRCQTSAALIVEGRLWGAIYAHSIEPYVTDYQVRTFLHVLSRLASQTIAYQVSTAARRHLTKINRVRDRLQESIALRGSLFDGLTQGETTLLDLVGYTTGAAICFEGEVRLFGKTPTEEEVQELMRWFQQTEDSSVRVWETDNLVELYPPLAESISIAAGILVLALNSDRSNWIVWFRPEEVKTIHYGSNPDVELGSGFEVRFRKFSSELRGHSRHWTESETNAALGLQLFIQDVVMQRYTEVKKVNARLQAAYAEMEAFSYTVSHDLRAPLRGIEGFSEILLEDFSEKLGEEGNQILSMIQENTARMNNFITDILELSRVGRAELIVNPIDVAKLAEQVIRSLSTPQHSHVTVRIEAPLPSLEGDHRHMTTVFNNLLSNAIKYSAKGTKPLVTIGAKHLPGIDSPVFFVRDNGIGIDPRHRDRVFDMFSRLVTDAEYEGTGVGLALVKRIIQRHGGKIWIEGGPNFGTTFLFYSSAKVSEVAQS